MKFADLKTSEELHGLLVVLGVKVPESEFCWYEKAEYIPVDTNNPRGDVKYKPHLFKALSGYDKRFQSFAKIICPAYSFDEIWEMLPAVYYKGGCFSPVTRIGCISYERKDDFIDDSFQTLSDKGNYTQAATELLIWVLKNHNESFIQSMKEI